MADLAMLSRIRKRAPDTGTAFDFIRVEIRCRLCGKNDLQPLAKLAANDVATCRYCGGGIDLTTRSCRARLGEQAEIYKKIRPI